MRTLQRDQPAGRGQQPDEHAKGQNHARIIAAGVELLDQRYRRLAVAMAGVGEPPRGKGERKDDDHARQQSCHGGG